MIEIDKPIAFGERYGTGGFEIGDLYHIAAATCCRTEFDIAFCRSNDAYQDEFDFIVAHLTGMISQISPEDCELDRRNSGRERQFHGPGIEADLINDYTENEERRQEFCDSCFRFSKFTDEQGEVLSKFLDSLLGRDRNQPKALVWIRNSKNVATHRNSTVESIHQICDGLRSKKCGVRPVLIGQSLGEFTPDTGNLIHFYCEDAFKEIEGNHIWKQLQLFRVLREKFNCVTSVGMKSGGMDGPAYFSKLPVIFFDDVVNANAPNRMDKVGQYLDNFIKIPFGTNPTKRHPFLRHSEREIRDMKTAILELMNEH